MTNEIEFAIWSFCITFISFTGLKAFSLSQQRWKMKETKEMCMTIVYCVCCFMQFRQNVATTLLWLLLLRSEKAAKSCLELHEILFDFHFLWAKQNTKKKSFYGDRAHLLSVCQRHETSFLWNFEAQKKKVEEMRRKRVYRGCVSVSVGASCWRYYFRWFVFCSLFVSLYLSLTLAMCVFFIRSCDFATWASARQQWRPACAQPKIYDFNEFPCDNVER